jgi:hypothetical protein
MYNAGIVRVQNKLASELKARVDTIAFSFIVAAHNLDAFFPCYSSFIWCRRHAMASTMGQIDASTTHQNVREGWSIFFYQHSAISLRCCLLSHPWFMVDLAILQFRDSLYEILAFGVFVLSCYYSYGGRYFASG